MNTKIKKVILCAVCIAVPMLVGVLSSLLSGDLRAVYETMIKPPVSPPGWLFGVVWPILYVLMGIALYGVITSIVVQHKRLAVCLFALQLIFNFAWSIVFFRFEQFWGSVAVVVIMDILVFACIVLFSRLRKISGILMVPYLAWILFATYLSIGFAALN